MKLIVKHIKKSAAIVKHRVVNPVRDLILVENECFRAPGRAVRYATSDKIGKFNRIMSLTGHSAHSGLRFSTNILFLTERIATLFITTAMTGNK
jgi:hypothetical protein